MGLGRGFLVLGLLSAYLVTDWPFAVLSLHSWLPQWLSWGEPGQGHCASASSHHCQSREEAEAEALW